MEEMNALLARRSGTIKKNLNIKVISFFSGLESSIGIINAVFFALHNP